MPPNPNTQNHPGPSTLPPRPLGILPIEVDQIRKELRADAAASGVHSTQSFIPFFQSDSAPS